MEHDRIKELLEYIEPAALDYQDWVNVGMALKTEGLTANVWDEWSRRDPNRYHPGECYRKWGTFQSSGVTAGTIYQLAVDNGYSPSSGGHELDWDDEINDKDDLVIVDKNWLEGQEIEEPSNWNPVKDLITYLEVLFESTENVGYVTTTWEKDGKYLPTKGNWDRTAGQLIEELSKCNGDINAVIGDYKKEAGAWIRFNPLDGKGVKNENVTDYRYALVESDSMDIAQQNAIIRQLELPVACLVYSGNKSIHAIVKIEAANYEEYRKRVNYLYDVCQKNGLKTDNQNRNPSRLSRLPGVYRKDKKQFLIDTNIGKSSWTEWFEWIEGVNDDLPEPENLTDVWDNLPDLANPLIDGVLRQGHKMLLAGPSKAGKSYALIQLCIGIAEGNKWLGFNCSQGKVMYVNLELDRASCLHRFKDVYNALKIKPKSLNNIDIWNLRGKAVPMDKLAPKLIRRANKKNYIAIVIDPIYKVITGDENSADQMAHFTNQFDKICTELGTAVIYCHHHSKGYQGSKRSMDRASGSGVFARDPDALLDLVELEVEDDVLKAELDKTEALTIANYIKKYHYDDFESNVEQEHIYNKQAMREHAEAILDGRELRELEAIIDENLKKVSQKSAWRIEGTLREYPTFKPINLWFEYPIHRVDNDGFLQDMDVEGDKPFWQKGVDKRKKLSEKNKNKAINEFESAIDYLTSFNEIAPTKKEVMEYLGCSGSTFDRRFKESGNYKKDKENEYRIIKN